MSPSLKFLESVLIINNFSANSACIQSEDDRLCLLTTSGILVLQLTSVKDNTMPTCSYSKKFIEPTPYNIFTKLDIKLHTFIEKLSKDSFYETILRVDTYSSMGSNIPVASAKFNEPRMINCSWSAVGALKSQECLLATLTNLGSIDIYRRTVDIAGVTDYVVMCNVSSFIVDYYKSRWDEKNTIGDPADLLEEFQYRIAQVTPTAFIWSELVNVDDEVFSVLIIAHLCGDLTFWKVPQVNHKEVSINNLICLGRYDNNALKISALHYKHSTQQNAGLLFFGTSSGTFSCLQILSIEGQVIKFSKQTDYLSEKDLLSVNLIKTTYYKDNFYLFIAKENVLIVILSDNQGQLLDLKCLRIGSLAITGLNIFDANIIYVLTQAGIIKELKVECVENKLSIDWKYIYVKINWNERKNNGWFISRNQIFFGFLCSSIQTGTQRSERDRSLLSIFVNSKKNFYDMLLENSTNSLKNYWDCIEAMRITTVLDKFDNSLHLFIFQSNYDGLSLIQLKTYFWISKFYEIMKKEFNKAAILKPSDDILCIINVKLAVLYLRRLFERQFEDWTDFQKKSALILSQYLRQIVLDDVILKLELGDKTTKDIYNVFMMVKSVDLTESSICEFCGEKLISSSCLEKHHDTRCAVSMMQIKLSKLVCRMCKCSIHEEMEKDFAIIFCPFCDVPVDVLIEKTREISNTVVSN